MLGKQAAAFAREQSSFTSLSLRTEWVHPIVYASGVVVVALGVVFEGRSSQERVRIRFFIEQDWRHTSFLQLQVEAVHGIRQWSCTAPLTGVAAVYDELRDRFAEALERLEPRALDVIWEGAEMKPRGWQF